MKTKWAKAVLYVFLILWALVQVFSLYWLFTFSLKNNEEIFGENIIGLPKTFRWSNYQFAFSTGNIGRYFFYSVLVTAVTLFLTTGIAMMAAYALIKEAACMDDCSVYRLFLNIILPLMRPGIATAAIFNFLSTWNELMFATLFVNDAKQKTLTAGVQSMAGQYTTEWGPIGACLVIAAFPSVIIYLLLSKQIQKSLLAGAIKG